MMEVMDFMTEYKQQTGLAPSLAREGMSLRFLVAR